MEIRNYGNVQLSICQTNEEMGKTAAQKAGEIMRKLLSQKEMINCIFAAAPSQLTFLHYLAQEEVDWKRVNGFHMDEYLGFGVGHPDSFNEFLSRNIFRKVPFASVNLINGANAPEQECARYAEILEKYPADITFMGIGENGHLAFNDPPADFSDPCKIKVVKLDQVCRIQQVHDGCFPNFDAVPTHALTLTVPVLTKPDYLFCMVPGTTKAHALAETLTGPISEHCPASRLRQSGTCFMFTDLDGAAEL